MLKELISTHVSTKELTFKPGGPPAAFDVTVINQSDQFATFQVEVIAAGAEGNSDHRWYTLSPEISTKNPPGDSTQFSVQIFDTPRPGFVGLMNLTVRVFSMELRQEERQKMRLMLQAGKEAVALGVELPTRNFQVNPLEVVQIPVRLTNRAQIPAEAVLRLTGIDPLWMPEGIEQRLRLAPGGRSDTSFLCEVPGATQAISQVYPFTIEVMQVNGPPSRAEGSVTIAPTGFIEFGCPMKERQIPEHRAWWPNWKAQQIYFLLTFRNYSNVPQQISGTVKPAEKQPPCEVEVVPPQVDLGLAESGELQVVVRKRRHWVGLPKRLLFELKGLVSDDRVSVQNREQLVKLRVYPLIPLWLQILLVVVGLWLLWWASWLNPTNIFWGHKAPVNSVRFNGTGEKLITGANDQMIYRWRIDGFFNPFVNQNTGAIGQPGKAVRVVRYRPVNNNWVAAGLENGEIQLWDVLSSATTPWKTLVNQPDDRVFDLAFSKDSRSLFSGHGSGLVVQWNLLSEDNQTDNKNSPNSKGKVPQKLREKSVGFAVNALALVGPNDDQVAIGGRFNQLMLWNLKTNALRAIAPAAGSEQNYIFSLSTPDQKPYLLATSNNQGTIQIWNLAPCLTGKGACEPVDEWAPDKSVRSVAFSPDGCYLASGGEDGRALLWSLTTQGARRKPEPTALQRSSKPVNAVDVIQVSDTIYVATGGDNTQVEVERTAATNSECR